MKTHVRIITGLLVLLMLLVTVSACANTPSDNGDSTTTPQDSGKPADSGNQPGNDNNGVGTGDSTSAPTTDAPTEPTEEELMKPGFGDKYNSYTFNILATTNEMGSSELYECEANGITGNAISDALYNRMLLMQDKYGVTVAVTISSSAKTQLSNAISAGDYICDVSMIPARDSFSLATSNYLLDVNKLDELNLSASYWDQRIQKEYAIGDKLFCLEGDYTILDELRTMVCVYNDDLYRDYGYKDKYGSPYELVSSGKWTIDTLLEMISGMYTDVNNNGKRDSDDNYGMVSELTSAYYFFLGAGKQTIVNTNGEPTLMLNDSSTYGTIYNVFEKTMNMAISDEVLLAQLLDESDVWTAASAIFEEGRALFRSTSLSAVTRLTNMTQNYGILPIPAYAENQGGYYCWTSGNNHHPMTIPNTVSDQSRTAALAEALCYHSRYGNDTLYEAFYEVMRISKLCRQSEDVAMLDLVFNSKTYDFDYTAQITGIEPELYQLAKMRDSSSLNSRLNTLKKVASSSLRRFMQQMEKVN